MATFNKFQDFVEQIGRGIHHLQAGAGGDTLKVYLSTALPIATNTKKGDIAEITAEHGYPAGGADIANDWAEAAGVGTLTGVDVVFTAAGGSFGPFRYVIIYNDTDAILPKALVAWWDYGSSITCLTGETFTVHFGASILTLT